MKIGIVWEQCSWGGVDSHLSQLLRTWPCADDSFVLFVNKNNLGFERISSQLANIPGMEKVIYTSCSPSNLLEQARILPLSGLVRVIIYFLKPVLFFLATIQLFFLIKKHQKFDVILGNNGGYPGAWSSISAIFAAKFLGIPARIMLVHHAATAPGLFLGWFESLVDRKIAKISSVVVCVSYATRNSLFHYRYFDSEVLYTRVIYNNILLTDNPAGKTKIPEISELRKGEVKLVGMLGRPDEYKGHEDMLFALSRLSIDEKKLIKFVVIGKITEERKNFILRQAKTLGVEDNVVLLGYIDHDPIEIISNLDLLLVLSRSFEGFGLTLAEAMQAGTPIMSTNVGAIPEFVRPDIGNLINPCAPVEIVLGLRDFFQNNKAWVEKAVRAKAYISEIGRDMSEEYRQLFVECLSREQL